MALTPEWIDFVVCLLFGMFGIHKFREHRTGLGILYLLTLGLFGIGWIVDTARYLNAALKGERIQGKQINNSAFTIGQYDKNLVTKTKIDKNLTVTIDRNIKLSPGESLSKSHDSPKRPKMTLDEQWKVLTEQSQEHMKSGQVGMYACDLYHLSKIDRKEKRYNDQMKKLMISAYIHLSEAESILTLRELGREIGLVEPILPPAVIRDTITAMNRLNWSIEDYRTSFLETVRENMVPAHIFSINDCLDLICFYLEGDYEMVKKKIKKGMKECLATIPPSGIYRS